MGGIVMNEDRFVLTEIEDNWIEIRDTKYDTPIFIKSDELSLSSNKVMLEILCNKVNDLNSELESIKKGAKDTGKSIGYKWLDHRQLKNLREQLKNVASYDLKDELNYYIENNKGEGAYLMNIFSNYSIMELQRLHETVGIIGL